MLQGVQRAGIADETCPKCVGHLSLLLPRVRLLVPGRSSRHCAGLLEVARSISAQRRSSVS